MAKRVKVDRVVDIPGGNLFSFDMVNSGPKMGENWVIGGTRVRRYGPGLLLMGGELNREHWVMPGESEEEEEEEEEKPKVEEIDGSEEEKEKAIDESEEESEEKEETADEESTDSQDWKESDESLKTENNIVDAPVDSVQFKENGRLMIVSALLVCNLAVIIALFYSEIELWIQERLL
ncbi:unnamed protein product [Caenorhabditis sp. 36 PRJEB53466]|nr:unnamed protein product [Caenorhabditis sp. 36 PRJEB53466]